MSGRFPAVLMIASLLTACSHAGEITSLSSDYNKVMSDVRNQQLLLNIMRSSAREPLQFSAMGEVAATVHRSVGIDTVLDNLLVGGVAAIGHTVRLEARNEPVIKIAPLSDKEFTSGILRPTSPETLKQFIDLGWDAEFLLPLIVAGYQCPGGAFQSNSGKGAGEGVRRLLVDAAPNMQFVERTTPGDSVKLIVSDDQALEMLRSGVAGGYKIKSVAPTNVSRTSEVQLSGSTKSELMVKLNLCQGAASASGTDPADSQATPMQFEETTAGDSKAANIRSAPGFIKLRSLEGIVYFLGESYRACYLAPATAEDCSLRYRKDGADRYLFKVSRGDARSGNAGIETELYGTHYWVSRLDADDVDRTMKTFSFLDQLFALQVEPGAVSTTPTVLTIGSR